MSSILLLGGQEGEGDGEEKDCLVLRIGFLEMEAGSKLGGQRGLFLAIWGRGRGR
jgi:hypothetical protein